MSFAQVDCFKFHGIEYPQLKEVLMDLAATKATIENHGMVYEVRELDVRIGAITGVVRKLDLNARPKKGKVGENDEPVALGEHEGMGTHNYFLVGQSHKMLLAIGNGRVAGQSLLRKFLKQYGYDVVFSVVTNANAVERALQHKSAVKKLRVRLSTLENAPPENSSAFLNSLLAAKEQYGAGFIDVTIGVDARADQPPVKASLMEELFPFFQSKSVDSAEVEFMPDEHILPIDLIEDRLVFRPAIPNRIEAITTEQAATVLREVWAQISD